MFRSPERFIGARRDAADRGLHAFKGDADPGAKIVDPRHGVPALQVIGHEQPGQRPHFHHLSAPARGFDPGIAGGFIKLL